MCYTIYLIHSELIHHVVNAGMKFIPAMQFNHAFLFWSLALTPLTFGVSVLLFVFLEHPCMNPAWPSLLVAKVRSAFRRSPANLPSN